MSHRRDAERGADRSAAHFTPQSKAISAGRYANTEPKRKADDLALEKDLLKKCRDSCDQAEDDMQEAERMLDQAIKEYSRVRDKQHGSSGSLPPRDLTDSPGLDILDTPAHKEPKEELPQDQNISTSSFSARRILSSSRLPLSQQHRCQCRRVRKAT